MLRRYCFTCGSPIPRDDASPGALCQPCRLGGPQVPAGRLRWELRTREGGMRGPFSRDAMVDQILRGAVQPEDQVTRGGARWMPLIEHPDFAVFFLPGTPEYDRLHTTRDSAVRERRTRDVARMARVGGALAAMIASGAIAVYGIQNDLFVIPEEVIASISGAAGEATEQVTGKIEQAVDQDAVRRAAAANKVLPGEEVLTKLSAAWPQPTGTAPLRLHRGRVALWSGTDAGLVAAREHLEQAAVMAPRDLEVWGSLAEAWARLSPRDPSLVEPMAKAADRAMAIDPQAPAARRAAAAVAVAAGNRGRAADILLECGEPASLAGARGSRVDLGCAVLLAELQGTEDALVTLDERVGGSLAIQLALARVHHAEGRYGAAVEIAKGLSRAHAKEPALWTVLLHAAVAIGDWNTARKAGQQVAALAPWQLEERALLGAIELKVQGNARRALTELEAVIAHEAFARHPDRIQVFADAAAAAIAQGKLAQGIALADRGLAEVRTHPAVGLQKARALHAQGDDAAAEKVLRSLEPGDLSGQELARYHLGAARIYVDAGRERLAETELTSADEAWPGWAMVAVEAARNRLLVGNRDGAIDLFESVAFMDLTNEHVTSPLHPIWTPAPDWRGLQRRIDKDLVSDVRFANRGVIVMGVLAVLADSSSAPTLLAKGLRATPDSGVANAALAQYWLLHNNPDKAGKHAGAVINTSANLGIVHGVEGWAAGMRGDAPQARALFVQALQDAPSAPAVHRWRAETQLKAGDSRGARRSLSEALRLAPGDVRSLALMAELSE